MQDARAELVARVAQYLIKTFSKDDIPLVELFVHQYLMSVSPRDLAQKETLDLFSSIVSHWNFIQSRQEDCKIRIYNPRFDIDNWSCPHTIVEIVCENKPFLLDSIRMAIVNFKIPVHLIVQMSRLHVRRNSHGQLTHFQTSFQEDMVNETTIYIEIAKQNEQILSELQQTVHTAIKEVFAVVDDFPAMTQSLNNIVQTQNSLTINEKEFTQWLFDNQFVFLGLARYDLIDNERLIRSPEHSYGILKHDSGKDIVFDNRVGQFKDMIFNQSPLVLSKFHERSRIHRDCHLDALYLKNFDKDSKLSSLTLIVGLYTSKAYKQSLHDIPLVKEKIHEIFRLSSLEEKSYEGRLLHHIIESYPIDEFIYTPLESLFEMILDVYQNHDREAIKLFCLPDTFGQFYSCYVFIPKEIYTSTLREKIQGVLLEQLNGESIEFETQFSQSILARIHFIIRGPCLNFQNINLTLIENQVKIVSRHWKDDFHDSLFEQYPEHKSINLYSIYRHAFSQSYQDFYNPQQAVSDISFIESLSQEPVALDFFQPMGKLFEFRLKIFQKDKPLVLSDVIPILESFGLTILRDRLFEVCKEDGAVSLNDFLMQLNEQKICNDPNVFDNFIAAFKLIWSSQAERDKFNELILTSGLNISQVVLIRAIAKYLRQIKFLFSQSYIESACCASPHIILLLVRYFETKFRPNLSDEKRQADLNTLEEQINTDIDAIVNLDQDRILRRYFEIIQSICRTSFFQVDLQGRPYKFLSFKIDPRKISSMPIPVVRHEIYVYSAHFEGVHLRTGDVARGGLRWSDRLEDFRTEILGLVKAQQVKNSLIVPEGAKGGFIVKNKNLSECEPQMRYEIVTQCYRSFISAMLTLTDNYLAGKIITPSNIVAYDEPNPYLVVAADKGTATFSDLANSVALEYKFWLNDAFASGGSQGYDHKKIGITARGAFEAIKRHFRERSLNVFNDEFTVMGIGDMSGDVFGNAMLLSSKTKLLAAFNHLHIFIDPNPDLSNSFKERQRLFESGSGSWDKYDLEIISNGGGVFSRKSKSITLSDEIKTLCHLNRKKVSPDELVQALLKLPVDLFFNGGIGTFVKASHESHLDVGDKANDSVRIDATELGCKVLVEGGNLGVTQKGRIEFSLHGGAINTDSLDNSAGVDCSDHEVNIKIFLDKLVHDGELNVKSRNDMLHDMTQEVASLVLANSYRKNRAISSAAFYAARDLNLHERIINDLYQRGKLSRKVESLPSPEEIVQRKQEGMGLTRPELFVLYSHVKLDIKQRLVKIDFRGNSLIENFLWREFPRRLYQNYGEQLRDHPLRSQILSMLLANILLDELGISYVHRLTAETKASIDEIVTNTFQVHAFFEVEDLLDKLDCLSEVPHILVQKSITNIIRHVRRATRWVYNHLNTEVDILLWQKSLRKLEGLYPDILVGQALEYFNNQLNLLIESKVPEKLALRIASLSFSVASLDLLSLSQRCALPQKTLAQLYYLIGERLSLEQIRFDLTAIDIANHWEALSRSAMRDDLDKYHINILSFMVDGIPSIDNVDDFFESWLIQNQKNLENWDALISQISLDSPKSRSFVSYSVAIRDLNRFLAN